LREATLRHQYDNQAAIIVCILRELILIQNDYTSAANFVGNVRFPENAHDNIKARWSYYQGRIKAIQMNYTEAAHFFATALRKAPQDSAIGFKQEVNKWVVTVRLLQGEVPERAIFYTSYLRATLAPYFSIARVVRLGNVAGFDESLAKYREKFVLDGTLTLIVRLRQNVIRAAIRQISTAYSRVALSDVAQKLLLTSESETEYLVAKAIKGKVIEGEIISTDKAKFLQCKESEDVYRTSQPQDAFDTRIHECLELHERAIKALLYPDNTKKVEVETIEEQREREQLALEMAQEEEEDDF